MHAACNAAQRRNERTNGRRRNANRRLYRRDSLPSSFSISLFHPESGNAAARNERVCFLRRRESRRRRRRRDEARRPESGEWRLRLDSLEGFMSRLSPRPTAAVRFQKAKKAEEGGRHKAPRVSDWGFDEIIFAFCTFTSSTSPALNQGCLIFSWFNKPNIYLGRNNVGNRWITAFIQPLEHRRHHHPMPCRLKEKVERSKKEGRGERREGSRGSKYLDE